MEEIKFRAWEKNELSMGKVTSIDFEEKSAQLDIYKGMWGSYFSQIELMRCTGLKDKNGVNMYEGDIVKCSYIIEHENGDIERLLDYTGVIVFEDLRFGIEHFAKHIWTKPNKARGENTTRYLEYIKASQELEIIGNIYENQDFIGLITNVWEIENKWEQNFKEKK